MDIRAIPTRVGKSSSLEAADADLAGIPTRVGKSPLLVRYPSVVTGHPHAGGEIQSLCLERTNEYGPSPRGWGNQDSQSSRMINPRAIPTRVGKSRESFCGPLVMAGHPHAGGEIFLRLPFGRFVFGPSPRGWGNPISGVFPRFLARAIPTRVGKSLLYEWVMGYVLSIREFLEGS